MGAERGFHIGSEIDDATLKPTGVPFLYEPDHLTTHAVCFGMTGSGKTGLCLALLEEAARAGIPSLIVDLKGDLADLALTFPNLAPADFEPWIDPAEASRQGMTPAALAGATADRWKKGLEASGLGPGDIAALRARTEIAVYTPGSTAGRPVNVLGGFAPPAPSGEDDPEAIRSRISRAVTALLDFAQVSADPVTSPEAVYLSGSFERIWGRGEAVTLEGLIRDLSHPAVDKMGVMDLDDVFPRAKRMAAATALNALVAAPAFAAWTKGDPLDPARLLRSAAGRPRASVFYLAHLSDRERSFFLANLLASVVTWMREGSGSPSLKALVYIDEIFGYMPPHPANPPTKEPLLTLLKQARAFGVGVVLATQNPVDVDYKGLANTGTWLLGRLQTDNDRDRLLEGISGAAGGGFDRASIGRTLAALPPRTFVLHDAKEGRPRLFASRWAMSYLRGPLTKDEIRRLPEARQPEAEGAGPAPAVSSPERPGSPASSAAPMLPTGPSSAGGGLAVRPKIAEGIPERFAPAAAGDRLQPFLMASLRVVIEDAKAGVRESRRRTMVLTAEAADLAPDWARAREVSFDPLALVTAPPEGATYGAVPASWQRAATFKQASSSLKGWASANEAVAIFRNAALKIASNPGESRLEFEGRCRAEAERKSGEELRAYQSKVEEKARRLRAKVEKEELDVTRDQESAQLRKTQEAIGIGGAVLGALFGSRRSIGGAVLGAGSRHQMAQRAEAQVEKSKQEAEAAREELQAFEDEATAAVAGIERRWAAAASALTEDVLRPKKAAIEVTELAVLWAREIP